MVCGRGWSVEAKVDIYVLVGEGGVATGWGGRRAARETEGLGFVGCCSGGLRFVLRESIRDGKDSETYVVYSSG